MKYLAILMIVIILASMVGVGYVYLTAKVTVENVTVRTVEASTQPETFEALKKQVAANAVIGTPFTDIAPDQIDGYQLAVFQVQLTNSSFLPAEMVEIQVRPRDGDVMQIPTTQTNLTLSPRSTQIFEATILTNVNLYTTRELEITYYVWGKPFSLRTTVSN